MSDQTQHAVQHAHQIRTHDNGPSAPLVLQHAVDQRPLALRAVRTQLGRQTNGKHIVCRGMRAALGEMLHRKPCADASVHHTHPHWNCLQPGLGYACGNRKILQHVPILTTLPGTT